MTPKQKAVELVEKFDNFVAHEDFFGDSISNSNKKKSAYICVDEILKDLDISNPYDNDRFEWWNKVKQEIENL